MFSRIRSGLILLALGFVLLRIAQPYLHSSQFEQLVQREVDQARPRSEAGSLHARIFAEGRSMGLKINPDDIQVERLVRGYQVRVHYTIPLDFAVYRTETSFDYVARTASSQLE